VKSFATTDTRGKVNVGDVIRDRGCAKQSATADQREKAYNGEHGPPEREEGAYPCGEGGLRGISASGPARNSDGRAETSRGLTSNGT
jgi:hypothetical protein